MRKGGVTDSDLLDYMMGHRNMRHMHGGDYDHFDLDYIRAQYAKPEPFLSVLSGQEPFKAEPPRVMEPGGISSSLTQKNGETIPPNSGSNTRHRLITEWELEHYLSNGWLYVSTLPSGRIVVGIC